MSNENFYLNVLGQIRLAHFPLGSHGKGIFIRYDIVAGDDWEMVSGVKSGLTQCANTGRNSDEIVFNMPIECTFKTTNVYGWPQIIFSLYGTNFWGTEVNLGYARVHVPCVITNKEISEATVIQTPIITPTSTNIWSSLINLITNKNPELRDPKILAEGTKTKNLFTFSYGELVLSLESITKGTDKHNFDS